MKYLAASDLPDAFTWSYQAKILHMNGFSTAPRPFNPVDADQVILARLKCLYAFISFALRLNQSY